MKGQRTKPLRHRFEETGKTEQCQRCGVERSKSKGLPEFRLEGGTWSFQDPGCRDPRQSDLFAPDLSLPDGFVSLEEKPKPTPVAITVEADPKVLLAARIAEIFTSRPRHVDKEEFEDLSLEEVTSIFPGSRLDESPIEESHCTFIAYDNEESATVSLTLDSEGRHLGIYERWHVFAFSPRPLPKGLEQIVQGSLGDAMSKTEWMKKALVFRPEAAIIVDGPRKRIELRQHPGQSRAKALWSVTETSKEMDAT